MSESINRYKISSLLELIHGEERSGIILSGVIGSGKTTVAEALCKQLEKEGWDVLRYDGDDARFRTAIRDDTRLIVNTIVEQGLNKPFVFVDEVQKEPEIFDAIKLAFDKKNASFLVTGSNPAFLRTVARERLQRRGHHISLLPLSIPEIAAHEEVLPSFDMNAFNQLLWTEKEKHPLKRQLPKIKRPSQIDEICKDYLLRGGLPLAVRSSNLKRALQQIKLTAERGVTETYSETIAIADEIRRYLALSNSREFTYQGIHQKLRTTKRRTVDGIIDHLLNHGYIYKKRPYLEEFESTKSTYLTTYSWVDPGLVSYFQGDTSPSEQELGFRLEAYIHSRLMEHLELIPISSQIYYYKPFVLKETINALAFKPGEIDFLVQLGDNLVPIEVKSTPNLADIDIRQMQTYLKKYRRPFGIILYGGSPHVDEEQKIIYFPYWYV